MPASPRVLFLTDRYPPHHTGGYEVACANLAEHLRVAGVPLLVLTGRRGNEDDACDGYLWRLLHSPDDSCNLLELARWEREDHRVFRRAVREWKPDVIYAWGILHLFASLHDALSATSVPHLFNIADLWLPTHLEQVERIRAGWFAGAGLRPAIKRMAAAGLRRAVPSLSMATPVVSLRGSVFCSHFRQEQHREAGYDVTASTVIHNGIDLDRFNWRPPSLTRDTVRLLVAGRLVREKGVHTAIEATARLRHDHGLRAVLTIAGPDGYPFEYPQSLRALVTELRLDDAVAFAGMVDDRAMPDLYHRHDVLLFPSIGPEGLPMSVLEAMATGAIVIGTTTGGTGELLAGGDTGLTFAAGDAADLAGQIAMLVPDTPLADRISRQARSMVEERFAIDRIADETLQHLERVARGCVGHAHA